MNSSIRGVIFSSRLRPRNQARRRSRSPPLGSKGQTARQAKSRCPGRRRATMRRRSNRSCLQPPIARHDVLPLLRFLPRRPAPPPAMTADVRVVIRRHFPSVVAAPGGGRTRTVVEKVAEDITLRRRPARAPRT